VPIEPFGILY